MSAVVPLVPCHITTVASPQSNNQQLESNEGGLGELRSFCLLLVATQDRRDWCDEGQTLQSLILSSNCSAFLGHTFIDFPCSALKEKVFLFVL